MPFNLIQSYNVNTAGDFVFDDVQSTSANVSAKFIANNTQVTINAVPLSANGGRGTSGQVLFSNGTTGSPYWNDVSSLTLGPLYISVATVTSNLTIAAGYNGMIIGPVSFANGVYVSLANNSRMVVL